jgi:TonB family protein
MNPAPPSPAALEPSGAHHAEGWSRSRWFLVITLVFGLHLAAIFLFGEKKPATPRPVINVPRLTFAGHPGELLALTDPTLFVLPQRRDFASAGWLETPDVKPPSFRWTEAPRWLAFSPEGLGTAFNQLAQTQFFPARPFNFKPAPELTAPAPVAGPAPARQSTMQVADDLAPRLLPAAISLTNWPYADVLKPGVVQVLVDAAGNVISTAPIESSGYDLADQSALAIARSLRFKPAAQPAFGRVIFNWQTVPPATNTEEGGN